MFEMLDLERTITMRRNPLLKKVEFGDSPIELLLDFEQDHVCALLEVSPAKKNIFVAGGLVLRLLTLMCFNMTASQHMKAGRMR